MRSESIPRKPPVMLLVEDNPSHAELVRRSLESYAGAIDMRHVSDGEEALEYLNQSGGFADPEQSPRPHLVLLDLRLPRVDGIGVLRAIKSNMQLCGVPVVILSTSAASNDIRNAYRNHANSYLVKPLDFKQFQTLMSDVANYWLEDNHPEVAGHPH